MQGVSDHPQGILAGAAITVLLGILAGLLTLIARPSPSVEIDTVEVEEVDVLGSPIAPMASIDTPVTVFTKLPVRCAHLSDLAFSILALSTVPTQHSIATGL